MVEYSDAKQFTKEQVQTLFLAVDWESGKYPEKLYSSLLASETVLTARTDKLPLAGLMSAISDSGMNVYFPYLLVHPQAQGAQIGRTLVKMMLERYGDYYRKILVCPNKRIRFYTSAGWQQAEEQSAMMICNFPESQN